MSIVLGILKVIGIILLFLLLLLIVAFLLFFFYPLKYKINAYYKDEIYGRAEFNWFLRCFRGFVEYKEKKFNIYVAVLFWQIFPIVEKPKKIKKKKKKLPKKVKKNIDSVSQDKVNESIHEEDLDTTDDETEKFETPVHDVVDDYLKNDYPKESIIKNDKNTEAKSKKKIFSKILDFFVHIKYSLLKICDKIKEVINNISFYKDALQNETTKRVIKKIWMLLKKGLVSMKPKEFSLKLHAGFKDDPELEGKLAIIYGLTYPFHSGNIEFTPDFETDTKEASLYVKGKLKAYIFLRFLHLFMFDKDFKKLKEIFSK